MEVIPETRCQVAPINFILLAGDAEISSSAHRLRRSDSGAALFKPVLTSKTLTGLCRRVERHMASSCLAVRFRGRAALAENCVAVVFSADHARTIPSRIVIMYSNPMSILVGVRDGNESLPPCLPPEAKLHADLTSKATGYPFHQALMSCQRR